ncbi:suppressor of fused domain protein [Microbacterium sp.]|uniref:suppressor of fused domain protein n=1 Tax=Microbacterium sp. TaxID=51671 RepID=UPI0039E251D0
MMSKEEYVARAAADDEWAPGWEAIDQAFAQHYPGVEPPHLASNMAARAIFGGSEFLDGVSFFPSPNGYQHLVSYGMTALYAEEASYGGDDSGWGYEMTMKVRSDTPEDAYWAADVLRNLARYTYTSQRWFEPFQSIGGQGTPIRVGSDSLLTSLLVVPDTEILGVDTVHGRVEFLQLVGITQAEFEWLTADSTADSLTRSQRLAAALKEDGNPLLVTDLSRTHSLF